MRWTVLPLLMGCTAARGTIQLVEAEQDYTLAEAAEAEDLAVYAWTMADAYMQKSREEYAHADYQAAAELAAKASEWSVKAKTIAEGMGIMESDPAVIPETLQRTPDANPGIRNAEDDLTIPGEEAPPPEPAEGLDLDGIDPLEGTEETAPEDDEEELNIDDILFDDEDEDDEGDW